MLKLEPMAFAVAEAAVDLALRKDAKKTIERLREDVSAREWRAAITEYKSAKKRLRCAIAAYTSARNDVIRGFNPSANEDVSALVEWLRLRGIEF